MADFIIRKIRLAHCKKGPDRCEQCREMKEEKICLLKLFSPDSDRIQRRMIEIHRDGEKVWYAFDIIRMFEKRAEAESYAAENGIQDVEF